MPVLQIVPFTEALQSQPLFSLPSPLMLPQPIVALRANLFGQYFYSVFNPSSIAHVRTNASPLSNKFTSYILE